MRETAFFTTIAAGARRRELHRQLRVGRMRMATTRSRVAGTPLAGEFGRAITAALIGCWIISLLLHATVGLDPLFTLAALGLVYSGQASYHKYRLATDPGYKVPRCRCANRLHDRTETVLQSGASSLAGIPNSLLATLVYAAAIGLWASGHRAAIAPIAGVSALVGLYLSYVMVFRIRGLCSTCISLCALNILILLEVVL